jgi:2-haloacid dehalogenase
MKKQGHHKPVIVLDAGKVLVDFDHKVALDELSRRCGREIDLFDPLDLDTLFFPVCVGMESWEAIFHKINNALGLSLELGEWHELWCRIFTGEVPGMREALAELKGEFGLVALSNTDEVHWMFLLRHYSIFGLLDGWVVSYEEGVTKPDPAIYRAVVDRYCEGQSPFFYTDDNPQYVEAARRLGWDAEVFSDTVHFKEHVRKRLARQLYA